MALKRNFTAFGSGRRASLRRGWGRPASGQEKWVTDPFDEGSRLTSQGKPNSLALCARSPTQYNDRRSPIVLRLAGKGRGSELLPGQRGVFGEKCEIYPPDWRESDAARVRLSGFFV
jgi:hypothetical protein